MRMENFWCPTCGRRVGEDMPHMPECGYEANLRLTNLNGPGLYVEKKQRGEGLANAWPEGSDRGVPGEWNPPDTSVSEEEAMLAMKAAVQSEDLVLPTASSERKAIPLFRGLVKYFPRALAAVARHSLMANAKHNGPDAPITWNRPKSNDHMDALLRHLWDSGGTDPEYGDLHDVGLAWRALANLELKLEEEEEKSRGA